VKSDVLKIAIGIIGIAICLIIFPIVMDSAHAIQTESQADSYNVTTGAGETSADVTLTKDAWAYNVTAVTKITSTEATDVPVASSYVKATKALTIGGLAESKTRTLDVTYDTDRLGDYVGISSLAGVMPLIIFIGIFLGSGAAIWSGVKNLR